MTYKIVAEDATRYLPHNPLGIEYQHFVYGPRGLAFSGSRAECMSWVANMKRLARNTARRVRDQVRRDCGLVRGRDSLGRVIWE